MPDIGGAKAGQLRRGGFCSLAALGMKVEDKQYSPLAVDDVVRQSPPPDTTVKTGQLAHVVLSLGPRRQTMPELENRSVRAARIELLQSGMQVGEVSNAYLPGTQDDTVLLQDPRPGSSDVTSSHVNMLVSLSSPAQAYVMPDLVGMALNEAIARLNGAGLKIAKISNVAAPGAAAGSVVSESLVRGHRVDANSNIELQIAQ